MIDYDWKWSRRVDFCMGWWFVWVPTTLYNLEENLFIRITNEKDWESEVSSILHTQCTTQLQLQLRNYSLHIRSIATNKDCKDWLSWYGLISTFALVQYADEANSNLTVQFIVVSRAVYNIHSREAKNIHIILNRKSVSNHTFYTSILLCSVYSPFLVA